MEENSDAHMETDVSSTTDDGPETQQVTGSHGDVEMVIVVEKVNEEEDGSIDSKCKQSQGKTISSATTDGETSPKKDKLPHNIVTKTAIKENNASKPLLKSPIKCDSQKTLNDVSQAVVSAKSSTAKQQLGSADSSSKVEFVTSPGKSTSDMSPVKISQIQKVNHKSPFKDVKLVSKFPIKITRLHDKSPSKEMNEQENMSKSPIKILKGQNESPNKEANLQESAPNKIIKLQESSSSKATKPQESTPSKVIKLQESPFKKVNSQEKLSKEVMVEEKSPNKDVKSYKEVILQEKSPIKEQKLQDPIPVTGSKLEESSKYKPSTKDETRDLNKITISKDSSTSDSSGANNKISEDPTSITCNVNCKPENAAVSADESINTDQTLNYSQSGSDVPEKEHNKSISRELKSLIKSAKESKIISECTQLTSKTRKSRTHLDSPNTSLNAVEPDKLGGNRRGSNNSQVSNSSEKSEKSMLKRSMRSQNPEFVSKCKQFLNSVTSKVMKDDDVMSEDETDTKLKEKAEAGCEHNDSSPTSPKKKKVSEQPVLDNNEKGKLRSDPYCWRCHWTVEQEDNDKAHPPMQCTVCPRSYHYKCLSANERKTSPEKNWVCPDCFQILNAESSETRSPAMKKISLGVLCDLLKHALERMMDLNGVEPFMQPVDQTAFPDYDKYVIHPMDLSQMMKNITDGHYGSTEAFVADAQWILHNSIIFNTLQSKLTAGARALVRCCRAEMGEIEACPECYAAAHARRPTWFTDVCTTPHILLWAKLKGFPYWPAKGMSINSSGLVDVRFFGAHDRAWVPAKDCFLFSEKDPNNFRNKRQDILDSMQEAEQHIRNISRKYGKFVYPPFKTQFDPSKLGEQLKMMIPSFEGEVKSPIKEKTGNASPLTTKEKRRSNSKSSKSSANDGDGSESEDTSTTSQPETTKADKDDATEKTKPMDVDSPSTKEVLTVPSRKRRRSNLEEAVLTIMNTSTSEKKKKVEETEQKTPEPQQPSSSKEEKPQPRKEIENTDTTNKQKPDTPKAKSKNDEPSSSTFEEKETLRVTPIKIVALPRQNKQTPKSFTAAKVVSKPCTPKEEDKTPQKTKPTRSDKTPSSEKAKDDKTKAQKRRNSRTNRSLSNTSTSKAARTTERKTESGNEASSSKEKSKENKKNEGANKSTGNSLLKPIEVAKSSKNPVQFDDDTSLAVLARETRNSNSGLPTISNVCSLSTTAYTTAHTTATTTTDPITGAKTIEITVEATSNSSIFTPTSTDNVRNMKDAVTKLQKLRDNTEPVVGRVGVRAFARMTSPERASEKVQVEIKAEPVDLEEADEDRHNEKMDLMNACKLQPVNPSQSLRDVRINRVVVGPSYVVKKPGKPEARPRAKKTFPQPRRVEEGGRSELNGKNSMVYIPIQPPMTQAPLRALRPAPPPTSGNNAVNTVTTPLKPITPTISSPSTSGTPSTSVTIPTVGQTGVPTVGPTTVHTVPLMTSVNGQWMFSLQPVMSVGSVDSSSTPSPLVNGVSDRVNTPTLVAVPTPAIVPPTAPVQPNRTTTDTNTPVELPRLQQRPGLMNPLDAGTPPGVLPTPSTAGPLTAKLNQNAVKLADFFRTLLEECMERVDEPAAAAASLRLQLEQARWRHEQQLDEIKHNHELSLAEMRLSFEKEKVRAVSEVRRTAQAELETAIKLAKSKQWCASCGQEAQFYCCWNTAYCDHTCQRAHWPKHFTHCAQRPKDGNEDATTPPESTSRLQPQPDNLPKPPSATPALTVGGKRPAPPAPTPAPAPAPALNAPPATNTAQKTSIIVSMVEDTSGNQTMKCVGTYKPNTAQAQIPPLLINKQVLSDENAKKVVTSGGYLIVGASGNASVIAAAPTRRNHIQYFT